MKNINISNQFDNGVQNQDLFVIENTPYPPINLLRSEISSEDGYNNKNLSEILFLTSYPPRECGIATYSQDLIKALNNKFSESLSIKVCALESGDSGYSYPDEVKYSINTSLSSQYEALATTINKDNQIKIVLIQHEFGFFNAQEKAFINFLYALKKPIVIVFHTVLPGPDLHLEMNVKSIAKVCESIVVMTHTSETILINQYHVPSDKISVIPHGTHLVKHLSEKYLKGKYGLTNRKVLTTFGLLSSGKNIETTLDALPDIVKECPEVIFLIIGKTHPEVVKREGERYRNMLEEKVLQLNLQNHVKFINHYLSLPDLLEYLQLTDIYLFTTNDPNQAVSGTFAYAMSCGCPIISTPIPHAKELLTQDTGIIFDFCNSEQLSEAVIKLLSNNSLRKHMSSNALQKIVSTAWENSAVEHAMLFEKIDKKGITIRYNLPAIKLTHLKHMTTETGIIQFSKINQPDIRTGYTLDDNARAMVALCMYFKLNGNKQLIPEIHKYLNFIKYCLQPSGYFLNYVDKDLKFTNQNQETNLDDSNGRAIWALGYLISLKGLLPEEIIVEAESIIKKPLQKITSVFSTRAMAFAIKGLYYYHLKMPLTENLDLIETLSNRLVQMYKHESETKWEWFESYLTYANSILPEAMLYAWLLIGDKSYKDIAISSLDFLLSQTFNENGIEVISNKNWSRKGEPTGSFGEQPIDVAYTILTLNKFYEVFEDEEYHKKMEIAFSWFLGNNRLHQIVYNPCTGGCYDGLEEKHVNLNQGAESTVSYLMARLTLDNQEEESFEDRNV